LPYHAGPTQWNEWPALVGHWTRCDEAEKFSAMHSSTRALWAALGLVLLEASCSETAKECVPGSTQECLGAARCPGVQTCADNGSKWLECSCSGYPDPDAGATSADAASQLDAGLDAGGPRQDAGSDAGDLYAQVARYEWRQIASSGPTPRELATLTYVPYLGGSLLIGGNLTNPIDETWILEDGGWRPESCPVGARAGHLAAFDPQLGAVVVTGGRGSMGDRNDTWSLRGGTWAQENGPAPAGAGPSSSTVLGALVFDPSRGALLLSGGLSSIGSGIERLQFEFRDGGWARAGAVDVEFTARGWGSAALASEHAVLLFAGGIPSDYRSFIRVTSGGVLREVIDGGLSGPAGREAPVVVGVDSLNGFFMFGGFNESGQLDDCSEARCSAAQA
jgi:hypothetical protein